MFGGPAVNQQAFLMRCMLKWQSLIKLRKEMLELLQWNFYSVRLYGDDGQHELYYQVF